MNDNSQTSQTSSQEPAVAAGPPPAGDPNLENLSKGVPPDMKLDQVPPDLQESPQVVQTTTSTDELIPERQERRKSKKGLKLFLVLLLLFLLVFGIGGGVFYAVAYEKIDIGNRDLQRSVAYFVQDLPFTPKTPKYVLEKAYSAQKDVQSVSFDASVALSSGSLSILGLGNFDMQFVGDIDYLDLENLKAKMNVSVVKEFDMDIVTVGDKAYLRVNKVPSLVLSFVGISSDKISPFLGTWVALEQEDLYGSGTVQNPTPSSGMTGDELAKSLELALEEKVLAAMEMTEELLDGKKSYKFHFSPSADLLDYIMKRAGDINNQDSSYSGDYKASDYYKDLSLDVWVDANTYYTTKVSVSIVLDSGSSLPGGSAFLDDPLSMLGSSQQFDIAFVMKLSNHGNVPEIVAPADAKSVEQFSKELEAAFMSELGSIGVDEFGNDFLSI